MGSKVLFLFEAKNSISHFLITFLVSYAFEIVIIEDTDLNYVIENCIPFF